jgi:hypothetical protein
MSSFWGAEPVTESSKPVIVSTVEIQHEFDAESVFLLWVAEVITGDPQLAEKCVTDARNIASTRSGIFLDWLTQWARTATIQCAIGHSQKQIISAAWKYRDFRCSHGGHAPLSRDETRLLRTTPISEILTTLDPFVRTVMILRAIPNCAVQDCALRLGTSRLVVCAGCCAAAQWLQMRSSVVAISNSEPA